MLCGHDRMKLTKDQSEAFSAFERAGWDRAARAYHDHWCRLSIQSADAMLHAAKVGPGAAVLDVATGAGYVAAAADALEGDVTGLDFSPAQIELARQEYPGLRFVQGDAQDMPFEPETFDAVVMGFGMNHLPEPEKVIGEAWRVLRPGGTFAFTVWAEPKPGEGFGIVLSAIERHGVPNPDLPAAPPYFRFADKGEVASALGQAGFSNVETIRVEQTWRHSTPDQVFAAFNEGAVRATEMLRSQPEDVRQIIREDVRAEVSKLKAGDSYVVPVPAALSVGVKTA